VPVRCPTCHGMREVIGPSRGDYPRAADGVPEKGCQQCRTDPAGAVLKALRPEVTSLRLAGLKVAEVAERLGITPEKVYRASGKCRKCSGLAVGPHCERCLEALALIEDRNAKYGGKVEKYGRRMIRFQGDMFEMCVMHDDDFNNYVVGRASEIDDAHSWLASGLCHVVAAALFSAS
jgi:hypothetical protein